MVRLLLFLFILSGVTVMTVAGVAVAIHFFQADKALWTQLSWNSRPVLAGATVLVVSLVLTFIVNFVGTVVSGMLATREKPRPKPARPQSNRRTST